MTTVHLVLLNGTTLELKILEKTKLTDLIL
jgi:hypothetical protein